MSPRRRGAWAFVGLAAITCLVAVATSLPPQPPSQRVTARITDVYTTGARFPRTVIIAQASHTIEAHATLRGDEEYRCHIGDTIEGIQRGVALRVDPETCAKPQMSSVRRP